MLTGVTLTVGVAGAMVKAVLLNAAV